MAVADGTNTELQTKQLAVLLRNKARQEGLTARFGEPKATRDLMYKVHKKVEKMNQDNEDPSFEYVVKSGHRIFKQFECFTRTHLKFEHNNYFKKHCAKKLKRSKSFLIFESHSLVVCLIWLFSLDNYTIHILSS